MMASAPLPARDHFNVITFNGAHFKGAFSVKDVGSLSGALAG